MHPRARAWRFEAVKTIARATALTIAVLAGGGWIAGAAEPGRPDGQPSSGPKASRPAPRPRGPDDLARLGAEVIQNTRQYRASLEKLLSIYERDLPEAERRVEEVRIQVGQGEAPDSELTQAEFALEEVRQRLAETKAWIAEADQLLLEAATIEQLSKLPPLLAGGYVETAMLMRYNGARRFGLDVLPEIERYFEVAFGRPLPVSARGQTALHDRMGLDHRQAVDVALHPDSAEGRRLMAYLRTQGIPFIGVRGAVPGAATGAHIHIGQPSARLIARP